MRLKLGLAVSAIALLPALAQAQVQARSGDAAAAAQAASTPGSEMEEAGVQLDYEKFVLDNGLEVILAVDDSDPIVSLMTVAHVGSSRERPGRTGFAHFFEHMAFNDSENVPQGANRRDIPAWGGDRNGYTTRDRTVYYETVPTDAFDKLLWIDSDRLGYMINTVTEAALEREKQVVKNEKRQRVDNAPYGYAGEVVSNALYPEDHPYSWTVIGSLPDLQAATLADVREFYSSYYGPNNATLAIVGDIDIAETRAKVERWFGEIARGPAVPDVAPRPVELAAERRLMFEDNFAELPELRLVYPTPAQFDGDETALDALTNYLGSRSSPLYRRVVEGGLAANVVAFHRAEELAGELTLLVRANAGTDLDAVLAAVDEALADVSAQGIADGELLRIQAESETGLYNQLSTVRGKAEALAIGNEFAGDPGYILQTLSDVRALETSDLERVFAEHVAGQPRIMTSFVPMGETELAVDGSEIAEVWIEEVTEGGSSEEVSQGEPAEFVRTPTTHDRSEPPFGELPLSSTVPTWTTDLASNVSLIGTTFDETPVVSFLITFEGGTRLDTDAGLGATAMLASLMEEGSATRTAAEIEQVLGRLGAGYSVSANADGLTIAVNALARNLPEVVSVLSEIIAEPRFTQDAMSRARDRQLASIRNAKANPAAISSIVFDSLVYGDHPEGRFSLGTVETVENLDLDTLEARHAALGANGVRIHVAGDVSEADAASAFAPLSQMLAREAAPLEIAAPADAGIAGNVYFVDVPGSKQSVIRAGRLTVASDDPDHERIEFANQKLGGSIGGDLAQMLRIEKGYTYGAYSGVNDGRAVQPWTVRTSVRANATGPSLDIIRDMVANYGEEFGDAEAELTRNQIIKDTARSQESLNAKLSILAEMAKYDLSERLVEERQERLLETTTDDFRATAQEWFDPAEMVWIVVGDGATQRAIVEEFAATLPGEFVELDTDGNPV